MTLCTLSNNIRPVGGFPLPVGKPSWQDGAARMLNRGCRSSAEIGLCRNETSGRRAAGASRPGSVKHTSGVSEAEIDSPFDINFIKP